MQIDFHHAVTYVIARYSGFSHDDAEVVAYASQYVDDSSTSGFLRFDNGMRFNRQATAHPMLDKNNLDNDENSLSWLPFHFLPGNEGLPADAPVQEYGRKLICRPDSLIARDMMADVRRVKDRPHALHRLGIASHVFVDTFAHQGFVGQLHTLNAASDLQDHSGKEITVAPVPYIGHGQVGTCPDRPFLTWSYLNSDHVRIKRSNLELFMEAADRLSQEFKRYISGVPEDTVDGLAESSKKLIQDLLANTALEDGEKRHKVWLDAIRGGHFEFGAVPLGYVGKGVGSWKHQALGDAYLKWLESSQAVAADLARNPLGWIGRIGAVVHGIESKAEALAEHIGVEPVTYQYNSSFHTSHYKLFHDAARDQRQAVFGHILPAYGIYAA